MVDFNKNNSIMLRIRKPLAAERYNGKNNALNMILRDSWTYGLHQKTIY